MTKFRLVTCCFASGLLSIQAFGAEKVFRYASDMEIKSLDPALVDGRQASTVARALFEGLVTAEPSGLDIKPGVAESWTVSPDGLVYTFKLRKNAKWTNGRPVTAKDFLYSYERILSPETGAYYANLFDSIAGAEDYRKAKEKKDRKFENVGVKSKDDQTLVLTLKRPTPFFLELLTHSTFYPVAHEAVEKSSKDWARPENIITNGAFSLTSWKLKDKLVLSKNVAYHSASTVKLDKILAITTEDPKTAMNMYNAGEIDWMYVLPTGSFATLKNNKEFHTSKTLDTVYLRFNTTKGPLVDAKVRRAISLAIDRATLTEKVLKEGQSPAYNFVTPGLKGYTSPVVLKEDIGEAKKLLAEAGFPEGKGFPAIQLLFITDDQSKNVMTAVSAMLKRSLNINVSPRNQEKGVFYDALDALKFDIARSKWSANYMDAGTYLDKFMSANTYNNLTGYKNADFDKLIDDAVALRDATKRNELFGKAEQKLIVDDAVIVPLYFQTSTNLWKANVTGLATNPLDEQSLKYVDVNSSLAKK